mmetsp:Transcript_1570/g.2379  ORF Transcript_1570/g.2379 Transcript_1570/m.2379 type:complete len:341 (+) Transcript_1570:63-1085(+)
MTRIFFVPTTVGVFSNVRAAFASSSSSSVRALRDGVRRTSVHALFRKRSRAFGATSSRRYTCATVMAATNDLLVIGSGVLGTMVGKNWKTKHPDALVVGETKTPRSHEDLVKLGIQPRLRDGAPSDQFPYVIFSVPPPPTPDDYVAELQRAALLWNGEGTLLFTSSIGVYPQEDVTSSEDSPTCDPVKNPRAGGILRAEEATLRAGGSVVRLAGLYTATRGPQSYWLKIGEVPSDPLGLISMIHYEDAAVLCVMALESRLRSQILIGCDDNVLTRQGIIDAAKKSPIFQGQSCKFTGGEATGRQRKFDSSKTRKLLGWKPRWPSMNEFFEEESSSHSPTV